MSKLERKLILTEDGSHTLYVPELDEHYHSIHGAIQESRHVYINSGLYYLENYEKISILEIGFGTGLNALLTLIDARKTNTHIEYTTVEKYPISSSEIEVLNYGNFFTNNADIFLKIHKADWGKKVELSKHFILRKIETDLLDYMPSDKFDLVFFDAFAPSLQPELWSEEVFSKIYNSMHAGGVLVTYSVKGFVKRNLRAAGFKVIRIPGPPGKREMIRAIKISDSIS